jgi:hypothetical protein
MTSRTPSCQAPTRRMCSSLSRRARCSVRAPCYNCQHTRPLARRERCPTACRSHAARNRGSASGSVLGQAGDGSWSRHHQPGFGCPARADLRRRRRSSLALLIDDLRWADGASRAVMVSALACVAATGALCTRVSHAGAENCSSLFSLPMGILILFEIPVQVMILFTRLECSNVSSLTFAGGHCPRFAIWTSVEGCSG